MKEKSKLIDKLKNDFDSRVSYVRAKISVNLSSQIKALRRKHGNLKQTELANACGMKQSRISAMECPGAAKFTVETLIKVASALKVGLLIKFVSFSDMLKWENEFGQDSFNAIEIDKDIEFTSPNSYQQIYTESSLIKDINDCKGQKTNHTLQDLLAGEINTNKSAVSFFSDKGSQGISRNIKGGIMQ